MDHQSYIRGKNHWDLEPDLPKILEQYWDDFNQELSTITSFGELVGEEVDRVASVVDQNPPELIMHNVDGERVDRARLDPAHEALLKDLSFINRPPYEGGSWHHHFTYSYLVADPGIYCTLIVTNQTAYALYKYAQEYRAWMDQLLMGEAWGATWMTEIQGGSDLGSNTTIASPIGDGLWILDGGDKYFASNAGIADYALVTARPVDALPGPKGLALFLLPRLDRNGDLNFRIRRFKRKSGTRAVPTGEVEIDKSEAYLIGEAEQGIYYTLETLTVSRFANAIGAMGLARKAHLEALFRVNSRRAFGADLVDHPLVKRDLTDLAVRTAGGLALIFRAIEAFDKAWTETPPYTEKYHYARFLSHLAKNRTADHASASTQMAMELFGGLGFLDEYPVARLHREALITPIWEGTSNIQALDMLEVMAKKGAHEPFLDEMMTSLSGSQSPEVQLARTKLVETLDQLGTLSPGEAQWASKDALAMLADVAQVALLLNLSETGGKRYEDLARLYSNHFIAGEPYPHWALEASEIWHPITI
ncbi:MAG: acyl-CoA dehydrogenase [Anaerolineales bacterium]|nr:acyl-CoA dehydrogenase [Anaerolineales bacterium]